MMLESPQSFIVREECESDARRRNLRHPDLLP
jgi:hypothetical protein